MIRVAMFDLGLTLIDAQQRPFKHVREALTAIAGFKTADAKALRICLVSDFTLAPPPGNAKQVRALFEQYLGVLDATGLRPFFEPVQRRVTLSTHAGALKPDRAVFETALRRLRLDAGLDECLLITENAAHIKAARNKLHMQALQFRAAGAGSFDFDDWSQAPALVAHLLGPRHAANTHAAIKVHLAAKGFEVSSLERAGATGAFKASGQMWCPVAVPGDADARAVHVAVPAQGQVTQGPRGALRSRLQRPADAHIAEAAAFVASLAAHGQIASRGAPDAADATHEIEVDAQGRRRLVRKRFSAL